MEFTPEQTTQIDIIVNRLMKVGEGYSPHVGESAKIYDKATELALLTLMVANGFIDVIPPAGMKGAKYIPNRVTAEIFSINGIANYLEQKRIEKQKLLDKEEVESKLKIAQLENIQYQNTLRERDEEIERLRAENLRLSNTNTQNQIDIQPLKNKELKLSIWQKYWWVVSTCTGAAGAVVAHILKCAG